MHQQHSVCFTSYFLPWQ
uniref:N1780 protein n=1 Tax=Saccharomyces cerevisiae TaxID=4932 RepID=E9PAB1_YEASX|nr:N1780 [Saccharomyces cerevisiae]